MHWVTRSQTQNVRGEIKSAFTETANSILRLRGAIVKEQKNLQKDTVGLNLAHEFGKKYEDNVLPYISGIRTLRELYSPTIFSVADHITDFAHRYSLKESVYVDRLWHGLALAFESFGERLSKRFGAVVVNDNQELVVFSVVRPYPGLKLEPSIFVKGKHGGRAWRMQCAERAALADTLGYLPYENEVTGEATNVKAYINLYNYNLREKALKSRKLKSLVIYPSQFPCLPCYKFLTFNKGHNLLFGKLVTQGINAKTLGLTSPTRNMQESFNLFTKNGLPIRIITPITQTCSMR